MDKMTLLRGLRAAYDIAARREGIRHSYNDEINRVRGKIADLGEAHIWQRLLIGIPSYFIIMALCLITDVFYISGAPAEEQPILFTVFECIFFGAVIISIIIQVKLKKLIAMTKWYKNKVVVLQAQEEEIEKRYRPLIAAKYNEGMAAFPALGKKYHMPMALTKMMDYVESGRADSVKEMIEAYETDCHREDVRIKQDMIMHDLAEQQKAINQLECDINYVTYYR